MGDLPEPRYHTMEKDNSSVMMKVTATLGMFDIIFRAKLFTSLMTDITIKT